MVLTCSSILLSLLALHVILHWQAILSLFKRLVPDPRRRSRMALTFLFLSLLLLSRLPKVLSDG
jgi:hypothetical protein